MTLRIRPEAQTDIFAAASWYDRRNSGLGVQFVAEVDAVLMRIETRPMVYRVTYRHLRRGLCRRFPYAVYFDIIGDDIIVMAVIHQRRHRRMVDDRL